MGQDSHIRIATLPPGISFFEHKDMAGETLMYPLGMVLEDSHVLHSDTGDIAVRDYDCTAAWLQDTINLTEGIMVQMLHGIHFFDADGLAVRKIGYDGIDSLVLEREAGGISEKEGALADIPGTSPDHQGIEVAAQYLHPQYPGFDQNSSCPAERVKQGFCGTAEREIDKRPCHSGHHDPGMKELAPARVAAVICPAIDPVQDPAEITPVPGKDCTVLHDRVDEPDGPGNHRAD